MYNDVSQFLQAVFPEWETRGIFAYSTAPKGMKHSSHPTGLDSTRDCYWCVAAFPSGGPPLRTLARASDVRALVIDDVGTKVAEGAVRLALGDPTAIVETSAGNYQWTYRLAWPVAVADWPGVFAGVEKLIGVPLEGKDAVHLFRLPSGVNTKPGRGDFAVRLVAVNPMLQIEVGRFSGGPGPGPSSGASPRVHGQILNILKILANGAGVSRDEWVRRAHQIKALAVDEAEGWAAFDEWSRKWPGGYDPDETRRVWDSLHSVERTTGLGLLADAEAADAAGFAAVMNAEAAGVFDDGVAPPPAVDAAAAAGPGPSHKAMAAEITRREAGQLGWINGRPGAWAMFDPVMLRWVLSGNEAAMHRAVEEAVDRYLAGGGVGAKTAALLHKAGWHHSVASLVRVKTELRLEAGQFDANNNLLGMPGGVLEMDASGLGLSERTGKSGDFTVRATSVRVAAAGARGKYWEKFLTDFTGGDPELRRWWQVFCGYCLSGWTGEHVVVFVYGPGGNGKSVFLDLIGEVMGDYHARADHRLFMEAKGGKHLAPLAVLEGARLVTVPDVAVGATWDMGLVKQASGGGAITANRMRQDPTTFVPRFKIVMAGNEKPKMDTVDDGVRRRMRLVPALFRPRAVDTGLVDKLRGEKAEILRWMVDGWMAWAAGGLPACRTIDDATSEYLDAADVFGRWLAGALAARVGGKARIKDLFGTWETYKAADGSYSSAPNQTQQMASKLKDAGFTLKRDNVGTYVEGFETLNTNSKGVF